jgi:phosphatidylinositol glycan class B
MTRIQLATICLVMPFVLSLISHKEVRFIYPLLPALHILAAQPLVRFFAPAIYYRSSAAYTPQRLLLIFLVLVNAVIAFYTSVWHASGVLNIMTYLRQQHEAHVTDTSFFSGPKNKGITAGFLMPCHSTPWRSHLVYPTIDAWALSCEPPIDFSESEKAVYRDEADQFYDDPAQFLQDNMAGGLRHLPTRPSYTTTPADPSLTGSKHQHQWPDYLIFFQQLEPTLQPLLRMSFYRECWRTHNTAWHDDWRRTGDVIAWCLDTAEQDTWREKQRQTELARKRWATATSAITNTHEFHIDRMLEALKNSEAQSQNSGWARFIPSRSTFSLSAPWSSNQPSMREKFAAWRRGVAAYFGPRPSRIWRLGRSTPNVRDWIPDPRCFLSWRWWVLGESLELTRERELYS